MPARPKMMDGNAMVAARDGLRATVPAKVTVLRVGVAGWNGGGGGRGGGGAARTWGAVLFTSIACQGGVMLSAHTLAPKFEALMMKGRHHWQRSLKE